jgi:hypothetical protein
MPCTRRWDVDGTSAWSTTRNPKDPLYLLKIAPNVSALYEAAAGGLGEVKRSRKAQVRR